MTGPYLRPSRSTTTITTTTMAYQSPAFSGLRMVEQPSESSQTDKTSSSSLGIDIGKQMDFLGTDAERQALKQELAEIINTTVANGIVDLTQLRDKWQRDLASGEALSRLEMAMNKNGATHTKLFQYRVDKLVDQFFADTLASRAKTHELAEEDAARLRRLQAEQKAKEAKAKQGPQSWSKTNDAWDKEWDEW